MRSFNAAPPPTTTGYLKLTTKIPPRFEHSALVRAPGVDGARPIGLFFFFDAASAASRDAARRAAELAAGELRAVTDGPILASFVEWSQKGGLEISGSYVAADRRAA